jgi:hypothetical protein
MGAIGEDTPLRPGPGHWMKIEESSVHPGYNPHHQPRITTSPTTGVQMQPLEYSWGALTSPAICFLRPGRMNDDAAWTGPGTW